MTDFDLIYGELFDEVDLFGVTNVAALTPYPNIVKYLAEINGLNIEYKKAGNNQTIIITGSAKDKTSARDHLETIVLNISRPLAGHFFDNNNMDLFDQLICKPGMLKDLRAGELISRAENLLIICSANPQALTECNILPAKITVLTAAKTAFSDLSIIPHDKIKTRVDYGKIMRGLRNKIVSVIKNKLTNAMYVFEGINPPLLMSYLNITKLVHTGVRHNKPDVPTTFKSFQLYSATTNEKIPRGMLQTFEMPKAIVSRVDGSFRSILVPLGTCTIQAMAFGFENYSAQHIITDDNTDVIAINMTPIA